MKHAFILFLIFLICSSSSCENPFVEGYYAFWVRNNSNETISVSYSLLHPDTAISHIPRYKVIRISPDEKKPIDSKEEWEEVINQIPGKKLQVFVFSVIVDDNNWENVKANYLVKDRLELSINDLESTNWTINYP